MATYCQRAKYIEYRYRILGRMKLWLDVQTKQSEAKLDRIQFKPSLVDLYPVLYTVSF